MTHATTILTRARRCHLHSPFDAACFLAWMVAASIRVSAQVPSAQPSSAPSQFETRDMFFDDDGLIIHLSTGANGSAPGTPDGGDTMQREGWYWLGVWLRANAPGLTPWTVPRKNNLTFEQVHRMLEPAGDGVFYRHPKMPPYNKPWDKEYGTSRDQLVPWVAVLGLMGKTDVLQRMWDAMPEDVQGKHAFNGNWRNVLGQDGTNCESIRKRACNADNCPWPRDDTPCGDVDTRDCTLILDTQPCTAETFTHSCMGDLDAH